jgi:hypothetical protein
MLRRLLLPELSAQFRTVGLRLLAAPGIVEIGAACIRAVQLCEKRITAIGQILDQIKLCDLCERDAEVFCDKMLPCRDGGVLMCPLPFRDRVVGDQEFFADLISPINF